MSNWNKTPVIHSQSLLTGGTEGSLQNIEYTMSDIEVGKLFFQNTFLNAV
jgi:hypothetical protein